MLLSIRVEAELAEERTEDHGTTSSQLRRSDRSYVSMGILYLWKTNDTLDLGMIGVCDDKDIEYVQEVIVTEDVKIIQHIYVEHGYACFGGGANIINFFNPTLGGLSMREACHLLSVHYGLCIKTLV
ncbi:hypothetical protein LXL04_006361 [Taraxacum kok-saghyz]